MGISIRSAQKQLALFNRRLRGRRLEPRDALKLLDKLEEEVAELRRAVEQGLDVGEECADVHNVTYAIAECYGKCSEFEHERKIKILRDRKWEEKDGVYSHVKEGA